MKKKIIVILCSVFMALPLVLIVPKANTTQTSSNTITSYGNYTFKQGTSDSTFDFEMPLGMDGGSFPINVTFNTGSWMSLDYQFNNKYSGTMKFSVTSSSDWVLQSSNVYWYVTAGGVESTCYISATTTMSSVSRVKTFTVIFQNATSINFGVVAPSNLNFFNSSQSISISNASFTTEHDLGDIYTDIHQLRTWWDLYIPGMSTNLGNIANSVSSILSDTTSISSDTTSILNTLSSFSSDLSLLKQYTDGVEGYIDGIETSLNNAVGLLASLNYHFDPNIWPALSLLVGNDPSLLHFDGFGPYILYSELVNSRLRVRLYDNITYGFVYYTTYFNCNVGATSFTPTLQASLNTNALYGKYYTFDTTTTQWAYFTFDLPSGYTGNPRIYPLWFGDIRYMPSEIIGVVGSYFSDQYTILLQSINNGIGTLNDNYDTSEYEQYDQIIDNLNDSLLIDVNNSKNNILTDISNQSGIGSGLQLNNVRTAINGFYNDLTTIFPSIKYLVIFGMIILVLGVMF